MERPLPPVVLSPWLLCSLLAASGHLWTTEPQGHLGGRVCEWSLEGCSAGGEEAAPAAGPCAISDPGGPRSPSVKRGNSAPRPVSMRIQGAGSVSALHAVRGRTCRADPGSRGWGAVAPRWTPRPATLQTAPGSPDPNLGKCLLPRCPAHRDVNVSWNLSKMSWVMEIGVSISARRTGWIQTTVFHQTRVCRAGVPGEGSQRMQVHISVPCHALVG